MTRWASDPLRHVRVASPCLADWDEMTGDNRVRFCSGCQLNVYNLSTLTRREAERLLVNSEGRLCVRYYRRQDGTILTRDCPVGFAALKRRVRGVATAVLSFVVGSGVGTIAHALTGGRNPSDLDRAPKPTTREPGPVLMEITGVVAPPPLSEAHKVNEALRRESHKREKHRRSR